MYGYNNQKSGIFFLRVKSCGLQVFLLANKFPLYGNIFLFEIVSFNYISFNWSQECVYIHTYVHASTFTNTAYTYICAHAPIYIA